MVVIESVIKSNPLGKWYIDLFDTTKEDNPEHRIICLDVFEYANKIEEMGKDYGRES